MINCVRLASLRRQNHLKTIQGQASAKLAAVTAEKVNTAEIKDLQDEKTKIMC